MRNLFGLFSRQTVTAIFTALTGVALVTSASGVMKVAGNINSFKPKVPDIKTVENALKEDETLSKAKETTPTPKATITQTSHTVKLSDKSISKSPTPTITQTIGLVGQVGITGKPSISIRGGDDESDDESSKNKLQVDDDLEVSNNNNLKNHDE